MESPDITSTRIPPPPYSQTLSKQGSLLSKSHSLTQSATNVISRALTKVGLNNEIPYRCNDSEILCSICLDAMEEEKGDLLTVSACAHTFHRTCIAKWKKVSRKCPCCRGKLADEIGPTNTVLQNLLNLPDEEVVVLDRNENDMAKSRGNPCVGFILPLLLVPCFIATEALIFGILLPLCLLGFIFGMYMQASDIMFFICVTIIGPIYVLFVVCGLVLCFMLQISYLLFRSLKFYVYVSMGRIHWNDAMPFIIQRTFSVTKHCYNVLIE